VLRAEPYRNVGVEISFGHRSRRVAIAGREADADLSRVLDLQENVVRIPEAGSFCRGRSPTSSQSCPAIGFA
jgi:putative ABC transport system permease protein